MYSIKNIPQIEREKDPHDIEVKFSSKSGGFKPWKAAPVNSPIDSVEVTIGEKRAYVYRAYDTGELAINIFSKAGYQLAEIREVE